jgi:hypothetical protein
MMAMLTCGGRGQGQCGSSKRGAVGPALIETQVGFISCMKSTETKSSRLLRCIQGIIQTNKRQFPKNEKTKPLYHSYE